MSRRFTCPIPDLADAGYFIELPDRWLGAHLIRYQEANEKLAGGTLPALLASFARHAALLDDWNLPGVNGNPENWDLAKADLQVVSWVNEVVNADFSQAFIVPKA